MEMIGKDKFERAKDMSPTLKEDAITEEVTPEKMEKMLVEMENPVKFQKELAVKIKIALDQQIKMELEKKGVLSDHTRRWVESYNKILDRIQSALYGDKSVNLHLHKVSHSDISNKIRESIMVIEPVKKKDKKRKSED